MKKIEDFEELIKTYDEYLEFLKKANNAALSIAVAHGWAASVDDIATGIIFRDKIKELKAKLKK